MRLWLIVGSLNGLTAVIAGAFGWHWLEADSGSREIFNMGVNYQMWHALALLGVAWLASVKNGVALKLVNAAGWAFTAGIVFFSGTLYAFGLTGEIPVSGAAPVGGLSLMAGWAALIAAGVRKG